MYRHKQWSIAGGRIIEIQKTYSKKEGKGIHRSVRTERTPEAMAAYNKKQALKALTRIINENFSVNDIHLILTYRKGERPETETEFKEDLRKFKRQLRRVYRAAGIELKYVSIKAIGKRGAPHHHLIITGIDLRLLAGLWERGGIHPVFLYSKCDFKNLAEYFIEQANCDGGEIVGRRWDCSRNIVHPKARVSEVDAAVWREPPKALPGYEIDEETVEYGENPYTGIPYCYYKMFKREIKKPVMTPDGRLLQPDDADRWLRQQEFLKLQAAYDKEKFKIYDKKQSEGCEA